MRRRAAAVVVAALALASSVRAEEAWRWHLPPGVPEPRVPADNPMSAAKVELGRRLFYDTRLSGNGTIACATCHLQKRAFTDGRVVSAGSTGELTDRNAPPLVNLVWLSTYTWANPALTSLERQMEVPLFFENTVEMGVNDRNRAEVLARLRGDAELFRAAFPEEAAPVTFATVIKAIAAFERSIVSFDSKYDRFRRGEATLSPAERQGMALFFASGCDTCHSGFNFTDQTFAAMPFHDIGLAVSYPNRGVFEVSGDPADQGKFRTPSLRNVALTAPYLHDGRAATLDQAIDAHAGILLESNSPRRAPPPAAWPLAQRSPSPPQVRASWVGKAIGGLTDRDKGDLVAFLGTLTDLTLPTASELSSP